MSASCSRTLLSDPGISIAVIESLPSEKPLGFTYEPIAPNFYKLINNITYFEFNGTYYEELDGVFVPAIASTVNGTFTLKPATSIEAAGTDGAKSSHFPINLFCSSLCRGCKVPSVNKFPSS